MVSDIVTSDAHGTDAVCPVTGLPIVCRPDWSEVRVDSRYSVTVKVIGGHIVHSTPRGYATLEGVARVNAIHHEAIRQAVPTGEPHVHVADYAAFQGAAPEARRAFADDVRERQGLAALIFHNVPPLLKLSIRLGKRFARLHVPVEIVPDYRVAMRRAVQILEDEGLVGLPRLQPASWPSRQPEAGALELEGYQVSYRVVDGHIVHGRPVGRLGLREMERHLEFESMVLSSLDARRGTPVFVIDLSGLEGLSAAARRLYVASLRNRQRITPIALYVCHGANPVLRNAINISRPFLPFRIRIARDQATAFEIARRDTSTADTPVRRLRAILFPKEAGRRPVDAGHVDDLLRLVSNVEWERDGPISVGWSHPDDHPLVPVVDALELIKAEVDDLFRASRSTEEALRTSEERYRNILDSIVDGYYEIDFEGRLLAFNDSLLRIFGFSRTEIETIDPRSLMRPDDLALAMETFQRVLTTGQPAHTTDWEMLRKDGSEIIVQASVSLVSDPSGRAVGFRGIVRDITERVRTAREKADLEVQLQRSQRMEAIGTLAGGIAHNFNNLLMGIQGNISLLARELAPESPKTKRLATIEALVNGGSKLTAQLLGYARAGRVDVRVVNLNTLILETAETFSLTRREYRVHTDLAEGRLLIKVDPAQIEQALLNLLINAADAMPRGGDIVITSRLVPHTELAGVDPDVTEGDHVVVSVRDTGCGMDEDTIEHIFEPFFTTKGMSGGTGLGLASTYGIVRAHGGQINVRSSVGEGSEFNVWFPAAGGDPDPAGPSPRAPVKGEGTVLVVEDDEAVLDACGAMLAHLQYTPICVGSGEAAVDIYRRRKAEIDQVVLDLVLSDLSGGEVFDRIRAIDPHARVLLASGYSLEGEAAGLLERGCNDFIQKPFTMEQLSVKLERLLRGAGV